MQFQLFKSEVHARNGIGHFFMTTEFMKNLDFQIVKASSVHNL